jgi:1,4-alpha-glucan branching enzyme
MLKKHYSKTGRYCRVTFKLPADVDAESAAVCGDFNDWDPASAPMKRLKDRSFSVTLSLPAGRSYRFRYLLDGVRWENDWDADAYRQNAFGSDDSVAELSNR